MRLVHLRITLEQVVVAENAPWPYFCVILIGDIQVSKGGKGVLGKLTTADWFGDMRSPNAMATLITLSDSLVFQITAEDLAASARSPDMKLSGDVSSDKPPSEPNQLEHMEFIDATLGEGTFGKATQHSSCQFYLIMRCRYSRASLQQHFRARAH